MPKNQRAYNLKIKTPSLSLPIYQDFYAQQNMSPHFYKGIQKHFDHQNFSPFTNCLQMKKKHLSLLLPIQKRFERIFFSLFLLLFQPKKKSPSLSMGLQRHFDHPKFEPFTNCLHFKPLFKEKWHFSNSHLSFE